MSEATEIKLRWNLALFVPRLRLAPAECLRVAAILEIYLDDRSSLVKTASLQGLADLCRHDSKLLPQVSDLLRLSARSGTAAMRARSRILLQRMEREAARASGSRGTSHAG